MPADEPAAALLVYESFDDADLAARRWYDSTSARIVREAFGGEGSIEFRWNDGDSQPSGAGSMRRQFEPTDEVFIRFYIRLSKNWGWSGRTYHPHLIQFMTTENGAFAGPAATHLTLYVEPVGGKLRLAAQDIQNKDAPHGLTQGPLRGGFNGIPYDSQKHLFNDDRWHCVEAQFKLNTLDPATDRPQADGIARGWFDGQLVIDRNDVVFRSTDFPRMKINQFLLAPYFGPGLLPTGQALWIDELTISKRRVGPALAKP